MNSNLHQEAMSVLSDIWSLSTDARLGQLVDFLGVLGDIQFGHGLGDIEDDELLAVMYRHREELLARIQGQPQPSAATPISGNSTSEEIAPATVPA